MLSKDKYVPTIEKCLKELAPVKKMDFDDEYGAEDDQHEVSWEYDDEHDGDGAGSGEVDINYDDEDEDGEGIVEGRDHT